MLTLSTVNVRFGPGRGRRRLIGRGRRACRPRRRRGWCGCRGGVRCGARPCHARTGQHRQHGHGRGCGGSGRPRGTRDGAARREHGPFARRSASHRVDESPPEGAADSVSGRDPGLFSVVWNERCPAVQIVGIAPPARGGATTESTTGCELPISADAVCAASVVRIGACPSASGRSRATDDRRMPCRPRGVPCGACVTPENKGWRVRTARSPGLGVAILPESGAPRARHRGRAAQGRGRKPASCSAITRSTSAGSAVARPSPGCGP